MIAAHGPSWNHVDTAGDWLVLGLTAGIVYLVVGHFVVGLADRFDARGYRWAPWLAPFWPVIAVMIVLAFVFTVVKVFCQMAYEAGSGRRGDDR